MDIMWQSACLVPSSSAIILMGERELVALLSLSSWCLVIVVWLFLEVPWVSLQSYSLTICEPIPVDNYGFLFNCTKVGQATVIKMALA